MATPLHSPLRTLLGALAAAALVAALAAAPAGAHRVAKRTAVGVAKLAQRQALTPAPSCRLMRSGGARISSLPRRARAEARRRCDLPSTTATPAANGSLYWGAWIGEQFTGEQAPWDMSAVARFEQITGKPVSLINFSSPFADCSSSPCSYYEFPIEAMENVRSHGAIPFFSWASNSTPTSISEPDFQLADVIAGNYDSYIQEWASAAKAWGHPFFLRFNWEMNGNWFPWAEGANGNGAGQYVAAWRHVHDIFTAVGASNATWTWCPNVDPEGELADLGALYPGDEYVDWTCLDGYNWGPVRGDKWRSFGDLFGPTYDEITREIAPSKPIVIGEVGSTEQGGSKATWIAEMLRDLPSRFPQVKGVQWFEKNEDADWPIESSASATGAFAAGISRANYLGNRYAQLGPAPVPIPG